MAIRALCTLLIAIVAAGTAAAQPADRYTPPGLYDVETVRLANGFRAVLKQRTETSNVAFRLTVGIGTRQFDCRHRETPHLLEHLLFSGTSRHSETELEQLVQTLGGSWNASTGTERTTYQMDIFDRNALRGLDVLSEIITDTAVTGNKLGLAKDIVYREEGGKPTSLRRLVFGLGFGKSAWKSANEWLLPGDGAVCSGLVDLEAIDEAAIAAAYRSAYVPENMTLIVVGNFDRQQMLARVRATFGALPPSPGPACAVHTPPEPSGGPFRVSSTLSPFIGSSGSVSIAFRTAGRAHPDAPELIVLSNYLGNRLYDEVRVRAGLSYAPEAVMFFQPDYGVLYVSADAGARNLGRVRDRMTAVLQEVAAAGVPAAEVELAKQRLLLQWVQGFETNAGLAEFYAEGPYAAGGRAGLRNGTRGPGISSFYARDIASVTSEGLQQVIDRYLRPERQAVITTAPTVTYTFFFSVIGAVGTTAVIALLYRFRRGRYRRRNALPPYIRLS